MPVSQEDVPELLARQDINRLEQLLGSRPRIVVSLIDSDGQILWGSRAGLTAMFGREPSSYIGDDIWSFIHPNDRPSVAGNLRLAAAGVAVSFRYRALTQDGDWRPMVSVSWQIPGYADAIVTLSVPTN